MITAPDGKAFRLKVRNFVPYFDNDAMRAHCLAAEVAKVQQAIHLANPNVILSESERRLRDKHRTPVLKQATVSPKDSDTGASHCEGDGQPWMSSWRPLALDSTFGEPDPNRTYPPTRRS